MKDILDYYLTLHGKMGQQVDAKDTKVFDQDHRQLWVDCDLELEERRNVLLATIDPTPDEITELTELEQRLTKT